ncbi:hypothetical protein PS3A_53840 [Pseudomonas sp. 3A(2025)]
MYNWLMTALQVLVYSAGCAVTGIVLGSSFDWASPLLATVVLILIMLVLATCVHEAGHWLGARLAGMTVLYVQVFGIELQLHKYGCRVRGWRGFSFLSLLGYVFAVHTPYKPMRPAQLLFVAMGPLLNVLVGLVSLGLSAIFWPYPNLLLAFATINLTLGLCNLIPTQSRVHSDGFQLLTWWRKPDEGQPAFAHARLLALYTAGVAAEQLPAADLEQLDLQPMPMPLIALSLRLSALQTAGDWPGTLRLHEEMKALLAANPAALKPCAATIALVEQEMRFCQAMAQANADSLDTLKRNRDVEWYAPILTPRCNALRAALQGDKRLAEQHLGAAQRLAEQSQIRALAPFEAAMAAHIRALM